LEQLESTDTRDRARSLERPRSEATDANIFYEKYLNVGALTSPLKQKNEAIEQFRLSENTLLKELASSNDRSKSETRESLAATHALLALIYWLYPNHPGYDRIRNARKMLRNAFDAIGKSPNEFSESYVVGLLIQLRVLPFLIRSKKAETQELEAARQKAMSLVDKLSLQKDSALQEYRSLAFRAILFEGLGFSYWQLERDSQKACSVLDKSTWHFSEALKLAPFSNPSEKKVEASLAQAINQFLSSFASVAYWDLGLCHDDQSDKLEGEERLNLTRQARTDYEKSFEYSKATSWNNYKGLSAYMIATSFATESETEIDPKKVKTLLTQATKMGEEALQYLSLWSTYEADFLGGSWIAGYYIRLADYCAPSARHKYMLRSLELVSKAEKLLETRETKLGRWSHFQIGDIFQRIANYYRQTALNRRESSVKEKLGPQHDSKFIVEQLIRSLEYSAKSKMYYREDRFAIRLVDGCLLHADVCYNLLNCEISNEDRKKYSRLAKRACTQAEAVSTKKGWNEHAAQSNWLVAQILDRESRYGESALSYTRACGFYNSALKSSPPGSRLYSDYEKYMLAWSKIELAKQSHRASNFGEAARNYRESSELIAQTMRWAKRADLFIAESLIEDAEEKSLRNDDLTSSVESFGKAIEHLTRFIDDTKKEAANPDAPAFEALGLQLKSFCNARIILENSKQAYRIGNIEQSLGGLSSAEEIFHGLASNPVFSDSLRANELESMASLCNALRSFQTAQLSGRHELYLEARNIFGKASEESRSKALQPLLAGLSNFAAFLYYSKEIEKSLDTSLGVDLIAECDRSLVSAEASFSKLGNRSFLNMMKASKHILDATIKMSAAEREVERDTEKARLYSEARKSLSHASRYYELLGSSSRVKDALKMISEVKNHQKLIPLAHDIIAEIASNQIIYTAIASSSVIEQTPGDSARDMEQDYIALEHKIANDYISLGSTGEICFTISNFGNEVASLVRIDSALPEGVDVEKCEYTLNDEKSVKLEFKIEPGTSKQISLTFKPTSAGDFVWHPSIVYINSLHKYKISRGGQIRCTVESTMDFKTLAAEKNDFEEMARKLRKERELIRANPSEGSADAEAKITDQIFSLNEKISTIEERFLKTKNELEAMREELERVQSELSSLNARDDTSPRAEEKAALEAQEKLLKTRIERRRSLLEQVQPS
jgi:hypothetical protein